ncbi:putative ubiquitin carboxyl-terminal hydrolase, family 1 [Lyophyllum shimeji]|uniref:ubiquitinyl hydrolase 1 n=1 Tax=Lyophyllum shimeji TaxID=47721 RepID=A0A9P3PWG6_LYOSH|nr:putative ubiquitin carboxyl-terminal hydrolase, family 1 [Lyophyllum shimeji]
MVAAKGGTVSSHLVSMDLVQQPPPPPAGFDHAQPLDLVGGPFAVIESDPGVFTSLARKLGVRNIELVEMYDIEPWAVDHLDPHGLIFCFLWRKDSHRPADFDDPAAERVWFANQLSEDACASHALLNVLLNCPHVDIGDELRRFREDTEKMSPVMKGLAITNSPLLRKAHNSLARPADIRGALNTIAITTLDEAKAKSKTKATGSTTTTTPAKRGTKPPPAKRAKTAKSTTSTSPQKKGKEKAKPETEDADEAYHFIGYVPAYGKVWELDGLKSGPLEVGELPAADPSSSSLQPTKPIKAHSGWMDVVRPALRMKMEKYGGAAEGGSNIRFSLLAIVDGLYEKANDELQMLKRERVALERRMGEVMGEGWEATVDPALLESARHAFSAAPGDTTYAIDFGERKMARNKEILDMHVEMLIPTWETCIQRAVRANVALEDEVAKAVRANADHIKRTFDYEPFLKTFIERLRDDGLLNPLLGRDEEGNKIKNGTAKAKR